MRKKTLKKSYFVHQKKLKSLLQPIKKYIKKIPDQDIFKMIGELPKSWPGDLHIRLGE